MISFGLALRTDVDVAAHASLAERSGFAYLSCGEHIDFHSPSFNAMVALAAAAAVTSRVRVVTSVTLLPLYPPALLAKMATTLDRVSHGRLIMGVGVGGEYAPEFAAVGVPVGQRGARADEGIEILRRTFRGRPVNFRGRFSTLDGFELSPPPCSTSGPPIWVGGRSRAAIRRAALHGDGWLPYMYTPARLESSLAEIQHLSLREGSGPWSGEPGIFLACLPLRDGRAARREATAWMSGVYNQDFAPLVDKYVVSGTPAQCIARLREFRDAGAKSILLDLACPLELVDDAVDNLAHEVLPDLGGSAL